MAEAEYDDILYEVRADAAWITLNRPDALNALNGTIIGELPLAVAAAEADPAVAAVVLTGAGRAFCAGADLKRLRGILASRDADAINGFFSDAGRLFADLAKCTKPVIAAVNGVAAAGGLEFILACDLVVAVDSARIGDAHANFGVIPGGGGSIVLPRKVGETRAKQLLLTGDLLPAATLMDWGLVNQVVAEGELVAAVDALVAKIAAKSPLVMRRVKQLVADGADAPLDVALKMETRAWEGHALSQDVEEGLNAFSEKRQPKYTGR